MRRWGSALLLAFVLSIPAGTVRAQPCFTPLVGFGPIDPADGFPLYYQDSTGLALAQCLDAVCAGPLGFVLPNPNLPLSFPVNFPQDVGLVPIGLLPTAFSLSLNGRVGPFLTAVAPPPPAGLVGNPAAPQTVTGSACGTNFLRIAGPGFPPGGQQTDQFTVIIGKIAHVCGNGVLDLGEQCDDGNLVAGDCCSPTCQFEPAGQACANNICISGSTCDGAGACAGGTPNTAPCNDGNACTTPDTCAGGLCVGGPAPNCNDGNVCTTDTCNPATGCVSTPNTLTCD